jgi:3-deoxy-D-arabino-heptulosonate 7-phosphate (DAHP) synthase
MPNSDDRHIQRIRPLISPAVLNEELPASAAVVDFIDDACLSLEATLPLMEQLAATVHNGPVG